MKFSEEVDCCMAPVLETSEMMRSAYLFEKGLLTYTKAEDWGLLRLVKTSAGGFNTEESNFRGGQAPALGQHSPEVLTALLSATPDQIESWQMRGII